MNLIVSTEEFRAGSITYITENKEYNNTLNKQKNVLSVLVSSSILFSITATITSDIQKNLYVPFAVLAVLSFAAMFADSFIWYSFISKRQKKYMHLTMDSNMEKAYIAFMKEPFTPQTEGILAASVMTQKNMFRRYSINSWLITNKLRMGDFNGAYSCIVNDPAVFAADRFFELKYWYDLADYYSSLGNDPKCIEYFDGAYKTYAELYRSCYAAGATFAAIDMANDMAVMSAYIHGEWQLCFDLIKMKLEVYNSNNNGSGLYRAETALEKLRQAECLYNLGEYLSALVICDEAGPVLAHIPYQAMRANILADKLHKILDSPEGRIK